MADTSYTDNGWTVFPAGMPAPAPKPTPKAGPGLGTKIWNSAAEMYQEMQGPKQPSAAATPSNELPPTSVEQGFSPEEQKRLEQLEQPSTLGNAASEVGSFIGGTAQKIGESVAGMYHNPSTLIPGLHQGIEAYQKGLTPEQEQEQVAFQRSLGEREYRKTHGIPGAHEAVPPSAEADIDLLARYHVAQMAESPTKRALAIGLQSGLIDAGKLAIAIGVGTASTPFVGPFGGAALGGETYGALDVMQHPAPTSKENAETIAASTLMGLPFGLIGEGKGGSDSGGGGPFGGGRSATGAAARGPEDAALDRPAIQFRLKGIRKPVTIAGREGETHADIISRVQSTLPKESGGISGDVTHGFITDNGNFIPRKGARELVKEDTGVDVGAGSPTSEQLGTEQGVRPPSAPKGTPARPRVRGAMQPHPNGTTLKDFAEPEAPKSLLPMPESIPFDTRLKESQKLVSAVANKQMDPITGAAKLEEYLPKGSATAQTITQFQNTFRDSPEVMTMLEQYAGPSGVPAAPSMEPSATKLAEESHTGETQQLGKPGKRIKSDMKSPRTPGLPARTKSGRAAKVEKTQTEIAGKPATVEAEDGNITKVNGQDVSAVPKPAEASQGPTSLGLVPAFRDNQTGQIATADKVGTHADVYSTIQQNMNLGDAEFENRFESGFVDPKTGMFQPQKKAGPATMEPAAPLIREKGETMAEKPRTSADVRFENPMQRAIRLKAEAEGKSANAAESQNRWEQDVMAKARSENKPMIPAIYDPVRDTSYSDHTTTFKTLARELEQGSPMSLNLVKGWIDPVTKEFHEWPKEANEPFFGSSGPPAPNVEAAVKPKGRGLKAKLKSQKGAVVLPQSIIDTANIIRSAKKSFDVRFNPKALGEPAEEVSLVLRKYLGWRHAEEVQFANLFDRMTADIAKLTPLEQLDFIDRYESKTPQATPELQEFADLWHEFNHKVMEPMAADTAKYIHKPLKSVVPAFRDYYLPRMYKRIEQGNEIQSEWSRLRSLGGRKGFKNPRTQPTIGDSIRAANSKGFELVSSNPGELIQHQFREFMKYNASLRFLQDMKDKGFRRFLRPADVRMGKLRPGWVKEPTEYGDVWYRSKQGIGKSGSYYMPESLATLLKNHLDPGLWDKKWYSTYRVYSNRLNMLQLGFSGFHDMMIALQSATTDFELGMRQLLAGHPVKALGKFARVPFVGASAAHYYNLGSEAFRILREGDWSAPHAKLVQSWIDANGKFELDREYINGAVAEFQKAIRDHGMLSIPAIAKAPFAAAEYSTRYLFKHIIPKVKIGAFMDMAAHKLAELGEDAPEMEKLRAMSAIADSVDNRFGMLNYDNLFWNRTWQNSIHAMVRAPGWYLGTAREYGGALADLIKGKASHRLSYAVATPLVLGIWATFYQYAATGTVPQLGRNAFETFRNFMFPLTGRKLQDGTPERIQFPSYVKDLTDVYNSMVDEFHGDPSTAINYLHGKANPLPNMLYALMVNADFKNEQIRNPADPISKQMADVARYTGAENLSPIAIQNVWRRIEEEQLGQGTKDSTDPEKVRSYIESAIGITVPKQRWQSTPFRNALRQAEMPTLPKGPYSKEDITRRKYRYALATQMSKMQGNTDQMATVAKSFYDRGLVTLDDIKSATELATMDPLSRDLKRSTIPIILQNYDKAMPEEKEKIAIALGRRAEKAPETLTAPELAKYKPVLFKILNEYDKLDAAGKVPVEEESP